MYLDFILWLFWEKTVGGVFPHSTLYVWCCPSRLIQCYLMFLCNYLSNLLAISEWIFFKASFFKLCSLLVFLSANWYRPITKSLLNFPLISDRVWKKASRWEEDRTERDEGGACERHVWLALVKCACCHITENPDDPERYFIVSSRGDSGLGMGGRCAAGRGAL